MKFITSGVWVYKTEFVEQAPVDRILKVKILKVPTSLFKKTGAILLMKANAEHTPLYYVMAR